MLGYKFDTQEQANTALLECSNFYQTENLGYPVHAHEASNDVPVFWYVEFRAYLWATLGAPIEIEITQ